MLLHYSMERISPPTSQNEKHYEGRHVDQNRPVRSALEAVPYSWNAAHLCWMIIIAVKSFQTLHVS